MDPLSLTIAVGTAIVQISKAISRLQTFGQLPHRISTLNQEVTSLESVVTEIQNSLQQNTLGPADTGEESLGKILAKTEDHLANLIKALEHLEYACARGKAKAIRQGFIWLDEETLFQRFQDDLSSVKASLNVLLSASNS
jgi:hypothetical protein